MILKNVRFARSSTAILQPYDQITVKRLSERELKSYESFEKVNKTVFKIDTLRLKMKNLFVNGYVYEELNDFVKSLEKKAGIEISE